MKGPYAPPRLLLSTRSLDAVTLAPRDRMLEIGERFREPESLAVTLAKAVDAGADGILGTPSPALRAALMALGRELPLVAVLPALRPQEELTLEPGVEPLIARARRALGPLARPRLGWGAGLGALRRGDLTARLAALLEAETLALPQRRLDAVVLAARLTDVALAAGHRAFFQRYARTVHRRFRAAAGLETWHVGLLLARLREWGTAVDFVVGPVNPPGLRMKPSPEETLAELARSEVPVIASELRAGGLCSLAEGARYALEHGARGLAAELADMDEIPAELRGLKAALERVGPA